MTEHVVEYLTIHQIARLFDLSEARVAEDIASGKLPAIRGAGGCKISIEDAAIYRRSISYTRKGVAV